MNMYDSDDALDRALFALPLEEPPAGLRASILLATAYRPAPRLLGAGSSPGSARSAPSRIWLVVLLGPGRRHALRPHPRDHRSPSCRGRSPTRRRWRGWPPAARPRSGSHFSPDPNPSWPPPHRSGREGQPIIPAAWRNRSAGPAPYRILVIEDDAAISRVLQLELEHERYEVDVARDGLSASKKRSRSPTSSFST